MSLWKDISDRLTSKKEKEQNTQNLVLEDLTHRYLSRAYSWEHYSIRDPAAKDILENSSYNPLDQEDVYSSNERPKIEIYPDYIFLLFHFPYYDRKSQRVRTGEIDIFVEQNRVVSFADNYPQSLQSFHKKLEDDKDSILGQGTGHFLYCLCAHLVNSSFPMLERIGEKLQHIEDDLWRGRSREIVRDLSMTKQEIISFRKTIRPGRHLLHEMKGLSELDFISGVSEIYFDDLIDSQEKVWDMLENYHEVVQSLEETNESILGHRSARSLSVLTTITVIILPLTMIASLWGMNIGLPGGGDPEGGPGWSFVAIVASIIGLLFLQIALFRWKKWI